MPEPDISAFFGAPWENFRAAMTSHFGDYPILPAKLPENQERMAQFAEDGCPCHGA